MKKLLICGLMVATFVLGAVWSPLQPKVAVFVLGAVWSPLQPKVAVNPVYDKALAWCEARIHAGADPEFFRLASSHIKNREIRWSINDPSGLHYTLLVAFAEAWDEKVAKEVVTPEQFAKQISPLSRKLANEKKRRPRL